MFEYVIYQEEFSDGVIVAPSGVSFSYDPMWNWHIVKVDTNKVSYTEGLSFVKSFNDSSLVASYIKHYAREKDMAQICTDESGVIGTVNTGPIYGEATGIEHYVAAKKPKNNYEPYISEPAPSLLALMTREEYEGFQRDMKRYRETGYDPILEKYTSLWKYRQATGWDIEEKKEEKSVKKTSKSEAYAVIATVTLVICIGAGMVGFSFLAFCAIIVSIVSGVIALKNIDEGKELTEKERLDKWAKMKGVGVG